jgi:hypothetical protein
VSEGGATVVLVRCFPVPLGVGVAFGATGGKGALNRCTDATVAGEPPPNRYACPLTTPPDASWTAIASGGRGLSVPVLVSREYTEAVDA